MTDIVERSALGLIEEMAQGNLTSVDITQAYLDRIADVDGEINAYLQVTGETALETAAEVDRRRDRGQDLPPLAGVPIAVKDVLTTKGIPTTAGSRILEGWRPPYETGLKSARP